MFLNDIIERCIRHYVMNMIMMMLMIVKMMMLLIMMT